MKNVRFSLQIGRRNNELRVLEREIQQLEQRLKFNESK